jgi:hypothetical protein
MRGFRFPRFAIFLMIACFFTILGAIGLAAEMSRTVQMTYYAGSPNLPAGWWSSLPWLFATLFAMLWAIGAIGYGVLFVLRRSGLHRLSRLDIRTSQQHL